MRQASFSVVLISGVFCVQAMKELVKGTDRYRHFINGEWVDSTVKEWLEVENPATEEVIASIPWEPRQMLTGR